MYRKISDSWLKHWDFILLDLIILQAAYVLSCLIWNGQNPYQNELYLNMALIICLADICTTFFTEGYKGIMRRGYLQEFKAVFRHMCWILFLQIAYLFLSKRSSEFSRMVIIGYVILGVLFLYGGRVLWKRFLLRKGKLVYSKRSVLLVTNSARAERVAATVLNHTFNEIEVPGIVLVDKDDLVGTRIHGLEIVATFSEILDYIQTRWVDGILLSVSRDIHLPQNFVADCVEMGVTVHEELTMESANTKNQRLDRVGGFIVLSTNIRIATQKQMFMKRALDICGGLVGMLGTGIITLFLAPAIYLASPGPIFFSQMRVGKNGRKFKIYKFRSMYMDAEERKKELMEKNEMQGFMFKMDADPRIIGSGPDGTRHGLGWFIRKTSLDEFPQFWNVLKGEMSLVGTRPPTVDEWEQYGHHHRARMATKPGLTGMWQVSGRSDITDFEEVVRLDKEYIENWSFGLDLRILFKTVLVVLRGSGSK